MNEASQAIVAVKREVQLAEWQRQVQARQEQGISVEEWCVNLGISKGAYYHRLRKVRKYMCKKMGVIEDNKLTSKARAVSSPGAVIPIRAARPKEKAIIEMQLGDLQIKFNEDPDAEQLKVVLKVLMDANKPVC